MDRIDHRRRTLLVCVLLAAVTMALYWPATQCDFVNYDDNHYVLDNTHVTSGLTLENVRWAFLSGYASNWHPVTWLSHMLDWQMFGLKPWGHHLTSVLLHALNAALVFVLLQQMTGTLWRSLFVAVLFAVHPLRVESVAWVAERKDVLSGFFGLLTLICYAKYVRCGVRNAECGVTNGEAGTTHHATRSTLHAPRSTPGRAGGSTLHASPRQNEVTAGPRFYALSLLFFALGLMSKPMLVTLPFVMLLLDYWPLGRSAGYGVRHAESRVKDHATQLQPSTLNPQLSTLWRLLLEKLPFFALALASSIATFLVQRRGGAMQATDYLSLSARVGNAVISYCRYLGKVSWPTDLAVFYPHPGHWPLDQVLLASGVLLGVCWLFFALRRRYPFLLVGWLWFVGTLVPTIGLVQVGDQAMADRYTYIPSLGWLMLAIWGACELTRRWRHHGIALSLVGSVAVACCMVLTRKQLRYWKDGEALFRHALAVTASNPIARNNLGVALDDKGQTDEAMRQYQEAIRLKPDDPKAHYNLGNALGRKGKMQEAISQFQEAIRLKPDYAEAHNNLGNVLDKKGQTDEAIGQYREVLRLRPDHAETHYNLGLALSRKGQMDEALSQFQEALRLKPNSAEVHNNLGMTLGTKGRTDEAILQFQEALRLIPTYAEAHNNLGMTLGRKGLADAAIREYQDAIRLKPDYANAYYNLGLALGMKGQIEAAISQFQEAVRLEPEYALAHNNLGAALEKKGRIDEAINQFQEAIRLNPDSAAAHNNLGAALGKQGRLDEAVTQYQEAVRLKPDYALAHFNLGNSFRRIGRLNDSIREYQTGLNLRPEEAEVHNNLGLAFYQQGRADEAIREFQEALRLKPGYTDARKNLNAVLAAKTDSVLPPGPSTKP